MPIRILLVEDNPGDARLIKEYLSEAAPEEFELAHAERLDLAIEHVARHEIDVVLLGRIDNYIPQITAAAR